MFGRIFEQAIRLFTVISLCLICACQGESAPTQPSQTPKGKPPETTSAGPTPVLPQQVGDQPDSKKHAELLIDLWGTPLGKMFRSYLFGDDKSRPLSHQSQDIVNRLFGNITYTMVRRSSLNMMTEDLYDRDVMTSAIRERLSLLETQIAVKLEVMQSRASRDLLHQWPYFIPVAILGGSPLFQTVLTKASNSGVRYLLALVLGDSRALAQRQLAELPWAKLVGKDFMEDYNVIQAGRVFGETFTIWAVGYFAFTTGSMESINLPDKVWLYGIQNFVDLSEI